MADIRQSDAGRRSRERRREAREEREQESEGSDDSENQFDDMQEDYENTLDNLTNDLQETIEFFDSLDPDNISDFGIELSELRDEFYGYTANSQAEFDDHIQLFESRLENLEGEVSDEIDGVLKELIPGEMAKLKELSSKVQQRIESGEIPTDIAARLPDIGAMLTDIARDYHSTYETSGVDDYLALWAKIHGAKALLILLANAPVPEIEDSPQVAPRSRAPRRAAPVAAAPTVQEEDIAVDDGLAQVTEEEEELDGNRDMTDTTEEIVAPERNPLDQLRDQIREAFSEITADFETILPSDELTAILDELRADPAATPSKQIIAPGSIPFRHPVLGQGLGNASFDLNFSFEDGEPQTINVEFVNFEVSMGPYDKEKIEAALPELNLDEIEFPFELESSSHSSSELVDNGDGTFDIVARMNRPILIPVNLDKDISELTAGDFYALIANSGPDLPFQESAGTTEISPESSEEVSETLTYQQRIAQEVVDQTQKEIAGEEVGSIVQFEGGVVVGPTRLREFSVSSHNQYNIETRVVQRENDPQALLVMDYSGASFEQSFADEAAFRAMYRSLDVALPAQPGQAVLATEDIVLSSKKPPPFGGLRRVRDLTITMKEDGTFNVRVTNIRFGSPLDHNVYIPLGKNIDDVTDPNDILYPPGYGGTQRDRTTAQVEAASDGIESTESDLADMRDSLGNNETFYNRMIQPTLDAMRGIDYELLAEMPSFMQEMFPVRQIEGAIDAMKTLLAADPPDLAKLREHSGRLTAYINSFTQWKDSFRKVKRKYKKFLRVGIRYNQAAEGGAYSLANFDEHFGPRLEGIDMRKIAIRPVRPHENRGIRFTFDARVDGKIVRVDGEIESAANWDTAVVKAVAEFKRRLAASEDVEDVSDEEPDYDLETYEGKTDIDDWNPDREEAEEVQDWTPHEDEEEWEAPEVEWRGNEGEDED